MVGLYFGFCWLTVNDDSERGGSLGTGMLQLVA